MKHPMDEGNNNCQNKNSSFGCVFFIFMKGKLNQQILLVARGAAALVLRLNLMKLSFLPALVVGSVYLTASLSHAQTTTGSMAVSAFIGQTCTLSATNMDFGQIVTGVANSATSTISLDCLSTPTSIASVYIDSGDNGATGGATRNLNLNGNNIPYVLSLVPPAAGTELTHDNALTLVVDPNDSTLHTITINGEIPAISILPSPGSYVDNVVITAIYNF